MSAREHRDERGGIEMSMIEKHRNERSSMEMSMIENIEMNVAT